MLPLGGKNLGSGPYASYAGMISAYRLSQRDVLTAVHASGESVTGRFLAYETTGMPAPPYGLVPSHLRCC